MLLALFLTDLIWMRVQIAHWCRQYRVSQRKSRSPQYWTLHIALQVGPDQPGEVALHQPPAGHAGKQLESGEIFRM